MGFGAAALASVVSLQVEWAPTIPVWAARKHIALCLCRVAHDHAYLIEGSESAARVMHEALSCNAVSCCTYMGGLLPAMPKCTARYSNLAASMTQFRVVCRGL